jgi:hypothetical protein
MRASLEESGDDRLYESDPALSKHRCGSRSTAPTAAVRGTPKLTRAATSCGAASSK